MCGKCYCVQQTEIASVWTSAIYRYTTSASENKYIMQEQKTTKS
jgi:hypothetical protein